jgi:hypothetical protein
VDEHEECQGNPRRELALDSRKGLRSFVGLDNYYHHFIHGFSKVARTLVNMLEKMAIPRVG